MKKADSRFFVNSLARFLQFPEDYRKGNARIIMEGQNHLIVENYKGICSYTEHQITLLVNRRKLIITGKRLCIQCYTKLEVEVSGIIEKIEYA